MDIKKIIKQMTLEEKVSLCSGKNVWETHDIKRLNIPSIMMADGPHGLRKQCDNSDNLGINDSIKATCFPTASTTACSFDKHLLEEMGKAIANECLVNNVDILLGPGINIKRSPLCGRNFEYFSEDPFLAGELGAAFVRGVQSKGVGTSVKHYAVNNQEKYRHIISAEVDERALREIYLSPFEKVVKENPYTLMCSYNRVNSEFSSDNKKLLTDILRNEWNFKGVVVTDWGACNDRVKGLVANLDLEMPTSYGVNNKLILDAINNGTIDEKVLDNTVKRILTLVFKCKENKGDVTNLDNHHLARHIAANSMVLLKNDENILPLKNNKTIGIIGELAKKPRYQGSGSSKINSIKLDNVYDALKDNQIHFIFAKGYNLESDIVNWDLINEALKVAKDVDIPIIFIGLTAEYESEGFDRDHMKLPPVHNLLVEQITKVNPNVVVVLVGGAPVEMPWINNIKGLLNAYLCGESGALAIIDLLFGKVNPSGKLAETYPIKLEDNPSYENFPGGNNSVYYQESIFVGYRYYESAKKEVLFPFGYGLSYTTFTYSNLKLSSYEIDENQEVEIKFKIKNIGDFDGSEICQIYIKALNLSIFKPLKQLKGFDKVFLHIGQEKVVKINLDKRSFAYYNVLEKDWCCESGKYEILVGSSLIDIHLKAVIRINAKKVKNPYQKEQISNYYNLNSRFSDKEFENLLGRKLPQLNIKIKRPFSINSTMGDIKRTLMGKILIHIGYKKIRENNTDRVTRMMMEKALLELPIRTVISFSGGMFNKDMLDALMLLINGKYVKGAIKYIKASK